MVDPKTQLKWSLGSSLPPSPYSSLPGKFATVPDVLNVLIIAVTVISGMFNCLCNFFCTHYLTKQRSVFLFDSSLTFPMVMDG